MPRICVPTANPPRWSTRQHGMAVAVLGLEARLRAVGRGRGSVLRRDLTPAVAEKQTQRARRNANGERIWELNSHRGYNAPIGPKNATCGPVWWCLVPARSGTRAALECRASHNRRMALRQEAVNYAGVKSRLQRRPRSRPTASCRVSCPDPTSSRLARRTIVPKN